MRDNEAVIQLLREVQGPQDVELQLDMNIYSKEFGQSQNKNEEIFFGTAVARIFIYVTKDNWWTSQLQTGMTARANDSSSLVLARKDEEHLEDALTK